MRGVHEAVQVELRDGQPYRLVWRARPYTVCGVEAIWRVDGRWWLDPGRRGTARRYFRLHLQPSNPTQKQICAEVYVQGRVWTLWRVAD